MDAEKALLQALSGEANVLGVVKDTSGTTGTVDIFVQEADEGFLLTQKVDGTEDHADMIYLSEDMAETLAIMLGQLVAIKQRGRSKTIS